MNSCTTEFLAYAIIHLSAFWSVVVFLVGEFWFSHISPAFIRCARSVRCLSKMNCASKFYQFIDVSDVAWQGWWTVMLASPRMQAVVPNAVSNRALNNCHSIHGRGEVSSQCHKESTIGCLMNGGQIFFRPFLLQLCFAPSPLEYTEQCGWGLGLIHECPARTFRLMETGLKLPIISAICLLAHSCPGPLCIIAHNSVFVGGMRCRHPDTGGRQQGVWGQTHSLLLPPPDAAAAAAAYQLWSKLNFAAAPTKLPWPATSCRQ